MSSSSDYSSSVSTSVSSSYGSSSGSSSGTTTSSDTDTEQKRINCNASAGPSSPHLPSAGQETVPHNVPANSQTPTIGSTTRRPGLLSTKELTGAHDIPTLTTRQKVELQEVFSLYDFTKNGYIHRLHALLILRAFLVDTNQQAVHVELQQFGEYVNLPQLQQIIQRHGEAIVMVVDKHLRSTCRLLDPNNVGRLTVQQMQHVLSGTCGLAGSQIATICTKFQDEFGLVNYNRFILSLEDEAGVQSNLYTTCCKQLCPSPIQHINDFFGAPHGYRTSTLNPLLPHNMDVLYDIFSHTIPHHTPLKYDRDTPPASMKTPYCVEIKLLKAQGIPSLAGQYGHTINRLVHMCLLDKTRKEIVPFGGTNIHTVWADWKDTEDDVWAFQKNIENPFIVQGCHSGPNIVLLLELCIVVQQITQPPAAIAVAGPNNRTSPTKRATIPTPNTPSASSTTVVDTKLHSVLGSQRVISCGWAILDIGNMFEAHTDIKLTRLLPVHGGSILDKEEYTKNDIQARREGLRKLSLFGGTHDKATIKMKVTMPPKSKELCVKLPSHGLICSVDKLPYCISYTTSFASHNVKTKDYNKVLHVFPHIICNSYLYNNAFKTLLGAKEQTWTKEQKKNEVYIIHQFLELLKDVWILLQTQVVPGWTVKDVNTDIYPGLSALFVSKRNEIVSQFMHANIMDLMLGDTMLSSFSSFTTDELAHDYMNPPL